MAGRLTSARELLLAFSVNDRCRCLLTLGRRELDGEHRASCFAIALRVRAAAVQMSDLSYDEEPELTLRARVVSSLKGVGDAGNIFGFGA